MNYEELLASRNAMALSKQPIPFGELYRKQIDGKYVSIVDLREDLKDSLFFGDALSTEAEKNSGLNHKGQIHFTLAKDSAGIYGVNIAQGVFTPLSQLLEDNPAVVAGKNFFQDTLSQLLDVTSYLHDKGIYHICYSPNNVFVRKGDNAVMLLFHGSLYSAINDQQELYGSAAEYVAPEVLEEGVFDARADIYSIGKLLEFLYKQSEVPLEMKGVIKKATNVNPEKRYQTPEEMLKSINNRKHIRSSLISAILALAVVGILFGIYASLTPEPEDIEFVKSAAERTVDDEPDDSLDPSAIGMPDDTINTRVDEKKMREYQAKAEQIFRKNFTRETERVLSKIYASESMNSTEKNFMAGNQSTMEELVKAQVKMGNEAGLTDARSQLIASQIIEQVSTRLKNEMKKREQEAAKENKE